MNFSQTESKARLQRRARTQTQEGPGRRGAPSRHWGPLPRGSRSPRHFSACTPLAFNDTRGPAPRKEARSTPPSPGDPVPEPRWVFTPGNCQPSDGAPGRAWWSRGAGAPALDPGGPRATSHARSPPRHRHEPVARSKTTGTGCWELPGGQRMGARPKTREAGRAHRLLGWQVARRLSVPHPARQPEGEGAPRGSPFPGGPHTPPADCFCGVSSHQHSQTSVGATEHGRDLISLAGHLAGPCPFQATRLPPALS